MSAGLVFGGAISGAVAGSAVYTYDAFGRLTQVDGSTAAGAFTTHYYYDAAGNRTSVTTSIAPVPAVGPVSASVYEDSVNNPIAPNITGGGTPVSAAIVGGGPTAHGAAWTSGMNIYYTPTAGYYGSDSFQYTASNGSGPSAPATVTVTVVQIPIWGSFTWGGGLVWQ